MTPQQKYRFFYALRILTAIPMLGICLVIMPIFWIITGKNSLDWCLEDWLEYKEPKKQHQAIVGNDVREIIESINTSAPRRRESIYWPPPKPIPPPKPTTNSQTDPYEY